jgi:hypothetical protein
MAADCKSAAPWSYGGSNPPLCTIHSGVTSETQEPSQQKLGSVCRGAPDLGELGKVSVSEPASPARKWIALAALAALGGLAWETIEPGKVRSVVLVLLLAFALRIVLTASSSR